MAGFDCTSNSRNFKTNVVKGTQNSFQWQLCEAYEGSARGAALVAAIADKMNL